MSKLTVKGKLKEISKKRRAGDTTKVASKFGFTPRYVNYVLKGERNNTDIVDAMFSLTSKRVAA
jgi:hypothetical protein